MSVTLEQVTLSLSLSVSLTNRERYRIFAFLAFETLPSSGIRREKSSNAILERRAFRLRVDSVHRAGRVGGEEEWK